MYSANANILHAAKSYTQQLGFSVFPCHSVINGYCTCAKGNCSDAGKHPATNHGVKDATKDEAKITLWFNDRKVNIGCATGEPSGVWVLDVDDIAALNELEHKYGKLPQTWIATTGKTTTFHYYFRHDERCTNFKNATKFAGSLDVRSTGGYVLLPPSQHKSGKKYEWLVAPDQCELANAPDWLIDIIPKKDEPAKGQSKPITIHRATTDVERCIKYVEKIPPAISGDNGHKQTYTVACQCVRLFGLLSDDELLDAFQTWNSRCVPPWNEKELRHKLAEARKVVSQPTPPQEEETVDDWPVLDSAAYQGLLGEIIKAIEPQTEADAAGVLITLLAAIGNVLGKSFYAPVSGGIHSTNLFACLVGDTASGKGQSWDIVKYLLRQVAPDWHEQCIAYGLSSGEGLVERVSDPMQEDGSFGVAAPQRLLCLETEFAKPVSAMRRENNTLSPILRSAWDSSTLEIMTRGKSKLRATNAHISIVSHITPEELRLLLADSVENANGFSNRFLWCLVRSTKSLPHGGNVSVLDSFVPRLRDVIDQAGRRMVRTTDADTLWEKVYDDLKESRPGAFGRATERARPQVLRLSLIYAVVDGKPQINREHLLAALAVWQYCEESARSIFPIHDDSDLERRIKTFVRNNPGAMRSFIRHSVSSKVKTHVFDYTLKHLEKRGEIVCVPVLGNRTADTYYPGVRRSDVGDIGYVGEADKFNNPLRLGVLRGDVGYVGDTSEPDKVNNPLRSLCSYVDKVCKEPEAKAEPANVAYVANVATQQEGMTFGELLDWRNMNGIKFHRTTKSDGKALLVDCVWLTPDCEKHLTPTIAEALWKFQNELAAFAPLTKAEPKPIPPTEPKAVDDSETLTAEEFLGALRAM